MKKRFLSIALTVIMGLSLASCETNSKPNLKTIYEECGLANNSNYDIGDDGSYIKIFKSDRDFTSDDKETVKRLNEELGLSDFEKSEVTEMMYWFVDFPEGKSVVCDSVTISACRDSWGNRCYILYEVN